MSSEHLADKGIYGHVVDKLNETRHYAGVSNAVLAELVGCVHITVYKYMDGRRRVRDPEVVRRMLAVDRLLTELIKKGILPIPEEINPRLRTSYTLEVIDKYLTENQ